MIVPPQDRPIDLTIFIPAYLEAENLAMLLPQITSAASYLTPHHEVLIIDTQQDMDNTGEICRQNGARHIHRSGGNSYGDAIRTAIAEARGACVLCMDADGSHDPACFASMWAQRETNDIVIGSRYIAGGQTENPTILIWMSNIINVIFRLTFSINAKDVTNSFRLYRRPILASLKLESNDFDILEEILIKAKVHHPSLRIAEVPITFGRRKAGESKRKLVQFAFGYLETLRRLRKLAKSAHREMEKQ